jgi:hypothetical protein
VSLFRLPRAFAAGTSVPSSVGRGAGSPTDGFRLGFRHKLQAILGLIAWYSSNQRYVIVAGRRAQPRQRCTRHVHRRQWVLGGHEAERWGVIGRALAAGVCCDPGAGFICHISKDFRVAVRRFWHPKVASCIFESDVVWIGDRWSALALWIFPLWIFRGEATLGLAGALAGRQQKIQIMPCSHSIALTKYTPALSCLLTKPSLAGGTIRVFLAQQVGWRDPGKPVQ